MRKTRYFGVIRSVWKGEEQVYKLIKIRNGGLMRQTYGARSSGREYFYDSSKFVRRLRS